MTAIQTSLPASQATAPIGLRHGEIEARRVAFVVVVLEAASAYSSLATLLLRHVIVVAYTLTCSASGSTAVHLAVALLRCLTRIDDLSSSLQTEVATRTRGSHILRLSFIFLFDDGLASGALKVAEAHVLGVSCVAVLNDSRLATNLELFLFALISVAHLNVDLGYVLRATRNRRLRAVHALILAVFILLVLVVLFVIFLIVESAGTSETPQTSALTLLTQQLFVRAAMQFIVAKGVDDGIATAVRGTLTRHLEAEIVFLEGLSSDETMSGTSLSNLNILL